MTSYEWLFYVVKLLNTHLVQHCTCHVRCNSLQFPYDMKASGDKTATTFIPFHTNHDYRPDFHAVSWTILCYDLILMAFIHGKLAL